MKSFCKYSIILFMWLKGLFLSFIYLLRPFKPLKGESSLHPQVVVSLTSYGKRVRSTLRFAILSQLAQSRRPDRVIVWLSCNDFSDNTLPRSIKRLVSKYGVEVRYCNDVRSYKKLVYTLSLCPEDLVITVDDDLVLSPRVVESLLKSHARYPESVISSITHTPLFDVGGIKPYNRWKLNNFICDDRLQFQLGASGVLYPPHSLHPDVTDASLFTSLAPYADDVWFWVMALLNGTPVRSSVEKHRVMPIDLLSQVFNMGYSLKKINVDQNRNDVQIRAVLAHYGIPPTEEGIMALLEKR